MELIKTEYSNSKGNGKLDKVLLKCKEPNYYKLTEFLYTSQNEQALILKALYECDVNIVLKFGILESIEKEYKVSEELLELPNFIRYFCTFSCNDNIKNIINHSNTISNYKICNYGTNSIGILAMKEYDLGSVENYNWNVTNFDVLKNIIKQVIFAILYAYNSKGFIHGDLHSGNILLKLKRNDEIKYEKKNIILNEFEAVIMDFDSQSLDCNLATREKSKLRQKNKMRDVITNILKFITSLEYGNNINLNFDYDRNKLNSLKSSFNENINYYEELDNIIDNMKIYFS